MNASVDFQKLLKRLPRVLRKPTMALNIAMTLSPEIAASVERVRDASKLRAHRRRINLVRSIALPVLSNAVDRALTLGESIQARAFEMPIGENITPLNEVSVSFGSKVVLTMVSVSPKPGTLTLIAGRTGVGKTTLLKVLQAANPGSALVSQFPRDSFVANTVFEELAFALQPLRLSRAQIDSRVTSVAKRFGLEAELDTKPHLLSAGYQQRLAIGAGVITGSKLILLDEPFSSLDRPASEELRKLLTELLAEDCALVVAEHRIDYLYDLADEQFTLADGSLKSGIEFRKSKSQNLSPKGLITVLVGPNGAGKTTHLRSLAKERGVLVPQPAGDLLFLDSVAEELRQADIDSKTQPGTAEQNFRKLVAGFDPEQNPRDLSEGERLALAIAIQLTRSSDFLMLDEPTRGLDSDSREALANLIRQLAAEGVELLVATHDEVFASSIATKTMEIVNGVITDAR